MGMAKEELVCPFSNTLCSECLIYRGRHYYISNHQQNCDCICNSKQQTESAVRNHSVDFQAFWKLVEPWKDIDYQSQPKRKISITVIDMESGETRVCQLEEAKTWEWDNPEMMRIIDGFHITSWDKLIEIVSFKAEKGNTEVRLYEAPRFMMLAGG
jgi:hypothetical protein